VIEIVFDSRCAERLRKELRKAGSSEIGGVLAAESQADGRFVVVDLSVQRDGSFASFVRAPGPHRRFMRRFFERTGHRYERFNYLGEWHSHPSFAAVPSPTDFRQMQRLIEERGQTSPFLALVVVKLSRAGELEASGHAFRRGHPPLAVPVSAEQESASLAPAPSLRQALKNALLWRRESAPATRAGRRT
jgi:proteasome lid subunit RPN8/RPN11